MTNMTRFLVILAVLMILISTNPSKTEYAAWANTKEYTLEPGFVNGLAYTVDDKVIDMITTSKNLYIATVYTTTYGADKSTSIGVLNNFVTLPKKERMWEILFEYPSF